MQKLVANRLWLLLLLLLYAAVAAYAKVNLSGVAAATTVAVNAETMFKWVRHPVRQTRETAKAVKTAVRGKGGK